MRPLRLVPLLLVAPLAAPLLAQQPRQLTTEDYARAERALGTTTAPLVTGTGVRPTWLPDGRFWYRVSVPEGSAYMVVDPAKRTRAPLFDPARLAAALSQATGQRVPPNRLPFQGLELSPDGRTLTVSVEGRRWR